MTLRNRPLRTHFWPKGTPKNLGVAKISLGNTFRAPGKSTLAKNECQGRFYEYLDTYRAEFGFFVFPTFFATFQPKFGRFHDFGAHFDLSSRLRSSKIAKHHHHHFKGRSAFFCMQFSHVKMGSNAVWHFV